LKLRVATILLASILTLIGVVYAIEDSAYTSYKANESADLKVRVANSTHVITDAACTLDIYNPAGTLILDDAVMNFTAQRYNFSFTFNATGEFFTEYSCLTNSETTIFSREVSIQDQDLQGVHLEIEDIQEDIGDPSAEGTTLFAQLVTFVRDVIGAWTQ